MATFTTTLSTGYYLDLIVTERSQNTAQNSTVVNYTLRIRFTGSSGSWARYPYEASYNVKLDGTTVASGKAPYDFRSSSTIVFASGTHTITHNSDGTKSMPVSGYWTNHGETVVGTGTASGTVTLTKIPRQTKPTFDLTSYPIGQSFTINLPRASTSYYHSMSYSFQGVSGYIGDGYTTSATWTPPLSLLNAIPNNTSATATISVRTYSSSAMNDASYVGAASSTISLHAASNVVPSITSWSVTDVGTTAVSAWVQNVSRIRVDTSASGSYGSTISRIVTRILGTDYSAPLSSGSITTGVIRNAGNISVVTTVTDSRGRTSQRSSTLSFVAYNTPIIRTFNAQRALSNGEPDQNGTYARLDVNWTVSQIGTENAVTTTLEYRARPDGAWLSVPHDLDLNTFTRTASITSSSEIVDKNLSYDFRLTINDKISSATATSEIETSGVAFHWPMNHEGFAFGGRSTLPDTLQSYWPIHTPDVITAGGSVEDRLAGVPKFVTLGSGTVYSTGANFIQVRVEIPPEYRSTILAIIPNWRTNAALIPYVAWRTYSSTYDINFYHPTYATIDTSTWAEAKITIMYL